LLRIVLPVRGEAQHAIAAQLGSRRGHERLVYQTALVMTLLVPGIRKEHQDLVKARVRKLRQHQGCIVTDDA
jgi:hypothetical protein